MAKIPSKSYDCLVLYSFSQSVNGYNLDSSGLCCIASYDGLKIKKIGNISSLLFWYL
ncbi:hypothetical protein WD_0894 [Wolbachia endosymbiont of Drosophila melanogaster]|nr:hypothetical protein WD_0894 [Wolbachia endosymbiont of Drosophila melanogaster]ACN95583.1 hypothetical protein WRi_008490 [Wolbachia sp. wRi]